MNQIFNILIIGAGRIGAFNDSPKSPNIITHAHAFSIHEGFNLLGFVDPDQKKSRMAAKIWKVKSFKNLKEAFDKNKIDIVCVASPDKSHFEILKRLVNYDIKLVLAEKPLATTLEETKRIITLYKKAGIPIVVNHTRRFLPKFQELREYIAKNKLGKFVTGNAYYGKGILHNGVHIIDLLFFLVGDIKEIKPYDKIYDYSSEDPSVSTLLEFKRGQYFVLQHIDSRLYTESEMALFFEKGKIKIIDSSFKIEIYKIRANKTFKGYKNLALSKRMDTSQNKALFYLAQNIYSFLNDGQKLKCSMTDALKAVELCEKIRLQQT